MAGHDTHGADTPAEPWSAGWLWSLVAGIVGAILAKWLGDIGAVTAVLIGIFVFLVFGVLLGMFWDAPSPNALGADAGGHHGHDHDHGHDDHGHGHDGHGHDGHGHGHAGHGHGHDHGHDHAHDPAPVSPAPPAAFAASPAPVAVQAVPEGGTKPQGLAGPRGGKADDLKEIEGIGPVLERLCNDLGIWHFDQIAAWGAAEIAWMDANLKGFRGRVTRDRWVAQAKLIVAEGLDAFRIRAKTNDY